MTPGKPDDGPKVTHLVYEGHEDPAAPQGFVVVDHVTFPRDVPVRVGQEQDREKLLAAEGPLSGYSFRELEPEDTSGEGR
jgi:hypothetical protein